MGKALLVIPPVFFAISFVFSMLGMGGAQLYVPLLYWVGGLDFKHGAVPLGLFLNLVNTSSAATTYARARLVDWRVAVPFGLTMALFAPLGAYVNWRLPTKGVILAFALFTLVAATLMASGWRPKRRLTGRGRLLLGFLGGAALGITVGLTGRGGGSFVVPLLYICGLEPKFAAATSSFVVSCSALSGFISHIFRAKLAPALIVATAGAVLAGSQTGSRVMARKMRHRAVRVVFATVLYGVALGLIVKDVLLG